MSLLCATSLGAPLHDQRTGGLALVGPSIAHPASFLYNPAALGLAPPRRFASHLDTTMRLEHGTIQRSPIDTNTGEPTSAAAAGAKLFADQGYHELFPHPLIALSSSLGSDTVVVSLSGHTAMTRRLNLLRAEDGELFDAADEGPGRYAVVDLTQYHLFGTLAASWSVADLLTIGVSTSLVWGNIDFAFARDTALDGGSERDPATEPVALNDCGGGARCGYEADAAAEGIRINGSAWGLSFAFGIVVHPVDDLDLGLAYVSRVLGFDGSDMAAKGEAWVRRSQAAMLNAAPEARDLHGRGVVGYALPDAINFGATWHVRPRLTLDLQLRWLNTSAQEQLKIRLTGSSFRRVPPLQERVDQYRGFRDVWVAQVGAGYQLTDALLVQGALMLETAALPSEAVTAATIDATKLDGLVSLAWRLRPGLVLRGGYALTWMPEVDVNDSAFSPSAMASCVDRQYDIDLRVCRDATAGRGLPSGAGSYSKLGHRLGASVSFSIK